jgi:hypothetical protein
MALAIGLALRALNFVIPGNTETTVIGNLVASWVGAWFLLEHSPAPMWLPYAVGLGVLTHIAGDFLTKEGIPVPVIWLLHKCRLSPIHLRTGATVERVLLVPLFLTVTICFLYTNTAAHDLVDPWLQRLVALG